jgi:hypothetical protein
MSKADPIDVPHDYEAFGLTYGRFAEIAARVPFLVEMETIIGGALAIDDDISPDEMAAFFKWRAMAQFASILANEASRSIGSEDIADFMGYLKRMGLP